MSKEIASFEELYPNEAEAFARSLGSVSGIDKPSFLNGIDIPEPKDDIPVAHEFQRSFFSKYSSDKYLFYENYLKENQLEPIYSSMPQKDYPLERFEERFLKGQEIITSPEEIAIKSLRIYLSEEQVEHNNPEA